MPTDLYLRRGDTITLRNGDDEPDPSRLHRSGPVLVRCRDQEPGTEDTPDAGRAGRLRDPVRHPPEDEADHPRPVDRPIRGRDQPSRPSRDRGGCRRSDRSSRPEAGADWGAAGATGARSTARCGRSRRGGAGRSDAPRARRPGAGVTSRPSGAVRPGRAISPGSGGAGIAPGGITATRCGAGTARGSVIRSGAGISAGIGPDRAGRLRGGDAGRRIRPRHRRGGDGPDRAGLSGS